MRGRGRERRRLLAGGPQGADRGRRHAQHLRAGHRAGPPGHGHRLRPRTAATRSAWSQEDAAIDIVLMDIMMPEMDGMQHHARAAQPAARQAACRMVAVTAKAMKGDREKCIEAGRVGLPVEAGRHQPPAGRPAGLAVQQPKNASSAAAGDVRTLPPGERRQHPDRRRPAGKASSSSGAVLEELGQNLVMHAIGRARRCARSCSTSSP